MKLLFITDGIFPFTFGGMQKHSFLFAEYLAKKGVEIELHHIEEPNSNQTHKFSIEAIKNIKLVGHTFPKPLKFPGHYVVASYLYAKKVYRSIQNDLSHYDFIYTKGFAGWELLRRRNQLENCPKVGVKFHGMNMFLPTVGIKQKLEQFLLRPPTKQILKKADVVFSYGGKVTTTIEKVGITRKKIVEIPTGISEDWLTDDINQTGEKKKFIFIGRYDIVKGIRELNNVLKTKKGDFEFHFVGPFQKEHQINKPHIFYYGQINDSKTIKMLLDEMDVLVLPSYSEGMPNVILEAMARGCAILATDVGAVEVIVDIKNGKLLHNSSEQEITKGLDFFTGLPPKTVDQMKEVSIYRAKECFCWDGIAVQTINRLEAISKC